MTTERRPTQAGVNPFKGPFPLDLGDPIFGRDREIEELLSLLVANRLVLLHSVSGCGKSSLIEAGLRPKLQDARLRGLATIRMPRRKDESSVSENGLIDSVLATLASVDITTSVVTTTPDFANSVTKITTLDGFLRQNAPNDISASAETSCFDLLIFDQFEEVFDAAHVSEADRVEFFRQVGTAFKDKTRWGLFAIREDYLGELEPYLRYLPTYLSARFRLKQLSLKNAAEAILRLSSGSGAPFEPDAALRLAEELSGTSGVPKPYRPEQEAPSVEPVYLQVVSQYIWQNCREKGL